MPYKLYLNNLLLKERLHGGKNGFMPLLLTDGDWSCLCLPKSLTSKAVLWHLLALSSEF